MKKVVPYIVLIILFITGFYIASSEKDDKVNLKRTRILLGTIVEIQVRGIDEEKAEDAINKAYDEIKRIDDEFSVYDNRNSIWKMNHSTSNKIQINPEIFRLLKKCDEFNTVTNSAFDVSLYSLSELWGFGANGNPSLPANNKIKEALNYCGWENVKLMGNNILQRNKNVKFNFGAVAKGYAVDCAVSVLQKNGITDALINAGGEIKQLGNEWIVGIQDPENQSAIIHKLKLDEKAVATSGDYEQYFVKDMIRYCHIIDPNTGYPSQLCKSVTIIADDDLTADALATGVFVMGPVPGIQLIEKLAGVEAYIIDKNNNEFYSSGFSKYILR